ncbi:hypothetical protein HRG_006333 [Hirsutella rhossiliensis]|uniref:Uncharacterized protein n=1 Tax=Hirsutella rhossiliensis TaxID=111463 RepID=A0A9P8MXR7_9HYPO|nr:uncharacterized protein HRG_06333 [Hirsutella rhossiliensis]KAH0962231.1 hypothetical protein HRG_06333 [Hirsutella rhossiliensis]
MKGRPVDELVYEWMFPKPKSTDPQTFNALLQRSLVPEVRQETQAFYGHLETQEAKYPGLDYTHATHRIRLSRWPWHCRLFRAFNALGLTHAEIATLTKWEGTKWAKEKFEKEQGVTIRDTTADGFPDWVEPTDLRRVPQDRTAPVRSLGVLEANDEEDDDDESDDELESVGLELNERLRAQAARREAGETSAVLDEEWEQWLKSVIETGELDIITAQMTDPMFHRATSSSSAIPAALIPPTMLTAARAGHWTDIPEFLQPVLQRTLEAEGSHRAPPRSAAPSSSSSRRQVADDQTRVRVPWPRRTYSDLRLPVGDASRTAQARGA